MEKTLHLTLKKKWFDMIASGEKTEEYREIKPYWSNRLMEYSSTKLGLKVPIWPNYFDTVTFRNGYSANSPTIIVKCLGIEIGQGKPQWGAPIQNVFIIKLGERYTNP